MDMIRLIVNRSLALREGLDETRALTLGMVGAMIGPPVTGYVVTMALARREAPEPVAAGSTTGEVPPTPGDGLGPGDFVHADGDTDHGELWTDEGAVVILIVPPEEHLPPRPAAARMPTDRAEPVGQNNIVASFHFEDGSIANLTYSTVGSASSGGERVEVFAPSLGVMTENFRQLVVNTSRSKRSQRFFAEKGYGEQMSAFFDVLRRGGVPPVTIADGARATVGCLRILDAARTQTPQAIEWKHLLA